jgi:hypothetical protein
MSAATYVTAFFIKPFLQLITYPPDPPPARNLWRLLSELYSHLRKKEVQDDSLPYHEEQQPLEDFSIGSE